MSAVVALAGYLDAASVENVIASWKMSTVEANQLRWTYARRYDVIPEQELKALIVNGTPREWILDLLEIQKAPQVAARLREWVAPVFPITGNDLLVAGMIPGKQMGDTLKAMKSYWVARDCEPGKNFFLETLDMFIDK